MEGITPTMDLTRDSSFGGGSGIWLFAILALFLFGGGFGGYGNRGNCATTEDLNNVSNFGRLESQVMNNGNLTESKFDYLNGQVQAGFTQIGNGICSLGYEIANKFADTNERIAKSSAEIKDLMYQNKIETLQAQVSQLQLAQATSGVVRYPTSTTYSVPSPCFTGCGCQNGI